MYVLFIHKADRMTTLWIFLDVTSSAYLETQDDGPNEPKYEAVVAVDNVMGPHVL